MRRYLSFVFAVSLLVATTACDEKLSDIAGPTPNLEPTFQALQRDVFEARDSAGRQNCTACHNNIGRTPSGNLNLLHDVAYDQLVNRPAAFKPGAIRVIPGDPDNSYIVHKVEGTVGIAGVRMPLGGPYLTDGQILILRRWIALGALNN